MNNQILLNKKINVNEKLICMAILTIFYILGLLIAGLIEVNFDDKGFSPLIILNYSDELVGIFIHSFLYFFLFPIIIFFLGNSKFGLWFIPIIFFIKGVFISKSISFVLENISLTLMFSVIITIEFIVLLTYGIYYIDFCRNKRFCENEQSYSCDFRCFLVLFTLILLTSLTQWII